MFEPLTSVTAPACPSQASILVIDDAESMRELLRLHLTSSGYSVATAEDAIVAGKLLLKMPPNLIITDVSMPYMSGIEFVAALRTEARFRDIPIVFLSSEDQFDGPARELGAAAYLTKPVSLDRLLNVVELHMPANRQIAA